MLASNLVHRLSGAHSSPEGREGRLDVGVGNWGLGFEVQGLGIGIKDAGFMGLWNS